MKSAKNKRFIVVTFHNSREYIDSEVALCYDGQNNTMAYNINHNICVIDCTEDQSKDNEFLDKAARQSDPDLTEQDEFCDKYDYDLEGILRGFKVMEKARAKK